MQRRSCWLPLLVVSLGISSCSRNPQSPAPVPGKASWALATELGPVEVIDLVDEAGAAPGIRLHAVFPDGRHLVRTIRFADLESSGDPGVRERLQTVEGGNRTLRVLRREAPDRVETVLESGAERFRIDAARGDGGFLLRAELERGLEMRVQEFWIAFEEAADPGRRASVQASLARFYGDGPLRESRELRLLAAVLESPSWERVLEELSPAGSQIDTETRRRIQRLCVGAAVASKISCFVSRFTPWGMVVCVPSTGINLACILNHVAQLGVEPEPAPCDCGCPCRR